MKTIGIYGASGHGKVVADIAKLCGYKKVIFIDDNKKEYLSLQEYQKKYNYPIAWGIGDNEIRSKKAQLIEEFVTLIHPKAIVAQDVKIDRGSVIMAGAIINPSASIGKHTIINTATVIEHDCIIEDFVHIAPNCSLAGNVRIGKKSFIGIGSTIIQNISIGENCIIGAASLVLDNIEDNVTAFGSPAKIYKKRD